METLFERGTVYNIYIKDIQGREAFRRQTMRPIEHISLQEMSVGTYILEVRGPNQELIETRKIVKR